MINYIILLPFLFNPNPDFRQGILLSRDGDYIKSEQILAKVKPKEYERGEYYFYRLINNFSLNRKKESEKYIQILEWQENLALRYQTVVGLLKIELMLWDQDEIDLADIGREMKKIKDRLGNGYGGKDTQKNQSEVLARLDKLIKQKEDEANNKGGGDASEGEADKDEQGQGKGKFNNQPQKDSQIGDESGKGTVDLVKMRKLQQNWGSLSPREQARAIQDITRTLSPRHREAIENYFRNLSIQKKR